MFLWLMVLGKVRNPNLINVLAGMGVHKAIGDPRAATCHMRIRDRESRLSQSPVGDSIRRVARNRLVRRFFLARAHAVGGGQPPLLGNPSAGGV